mgnify:CR=1 FL=1
MATLNLDIAQKIDIEHRELDSFNLNLQIENSSGGNYIFSSTEMVIFNIYDFEKEPILVCSSEKNINNYGDGSDITHHASTLSLDEGTTGQFSGKTYGRALQPILNTDKLFITGVYDKGGFLDPVKKYMLVTSKIDKDVLVASPLDTYSRITPCITLTDGNINISIQSYFFRLPQGRYNYEIKILSDLEQDLFEENDSAPVLYFTKCKTWMNGAFTVKKD